MLIRKIKERKEFKKKKHLYYRWISEKNVTKLQELFGDPEFYKIPPVVLFRLIHKSAHSSDPCFRKAMTDFFMSNPHYLNYTRKNIKKFPIKE